VVSELIGPLLKEVSRSFYLSLAVLPASLRPPVGLAYLLARAADTVADTRAIEHEGRVRHLQALGAAIRMPASDGIADVVAAVLPGQASPAERRLLERLPDVLAAYRALDDGDRACVATLLATIIEGMTQDLRVFPGEDADKLEALPAREDLERYTYLVAGCVGEFWTDVHVAHRPRLRHWEPSRMRALGVRFGQGLQLTNILRDVPRDLRQGRCYLPRQDLMRLGLTPRDLLDPAAAAAVRPLFRELLALALDHYEAGWQYTLAIPAAETRMRLACAWPLLIGLQTLERLAASPSWLEPAVTIKVPRGAVYAVLARSLGAVWFTPALAHEARRLRLRVRLET
jgi:farnesyl-diphosphate farnesyltransferase